VLAFVGNYPHPCHHGATRYDAYLEDFVAAAALFPGSRVYVTLPPAIRPPGEPNDDVAQAARDSGLILLDARTPLDAQERAPDGVHLLDEGSRVFADVLNGAR
jgi:hypothetical protein